MIVPTPTSPDLPCPAASTGGRRSRRLYPAALGLTLALAWAAAGLTSAAAHGTLIRGSVTVAPDPPRPGRAMVITVDLAKTNGSPVEGATLVAELTPEAPTGGTASPGAGATGASATGASSPGASSPGSSAAGTSSASRATSDTGASGGSRAAAVPSFGLQEYREPYGTYRTEIKAPPEGRYTLTVHDRTQPGEDNAADVPLRVGGNLANGSRGFTFPGGVGGSRSLLTWLLWLVGLPLVVGAVVVVLVRRSAAGRAEPDEAGDAGPSGG